MLWNEGERRHGPLGVLLEKRRRWVDIDGLVLDKRLVALGGVLARGMVEKTRNDSLADALIVAPSRDHVQLVPAPGCSAMSEKRLTPAIPSWVRCASC